ncbi:MAG: hypothetical protein WBO12_23165 [Xanthobacteraceae bacterium]
MDADRTRDVLDDLFAHILKAKTELIAHLIVHDARNHYPSGIGQRLQPGRHIDAVTEDVIPVDYDVADVNANPEFDAFVRRNTGIALDHIALNIDRAAYRVDNANELHQDAIASGFNNSAAMFGDLGINEFLAMRFDLAQRAFLIDTHQSAVTGDVACKNCSEPSIDAIFGH